MHVKDALNATNHRINSYRTSSFIESAEVVTKGEFTPDSLPEWLQPYVQNGGWAKRLSELLNQGYERQLRTFITHSAQFARKKYNHFNSCWSKASLLDTVRQMNEKIKKDHIAQEAIRRLEAAKEEVAAIYGAVHRLGASTLRYAATAQELCMAGQLKTTKFKFFCWLTAPKNIRKGGRQLAAIL